ncbi:MAG: hypothetical protein HOP08_05530 [Cyclobacteriaceae bacterium]|nr:hypothetical protein [Cyclobacteriaceae bacterium]
MVSILAALPISFFITGSWLNEFAFRTDLSWWNFIGAGAGALVWITVGVQTLKAARVNPTKSLKIE